MTPIATHMYQGLPFKIYRNIKCDTGLRDAPCSNYSILAAGDPVGRCKQQEREKLSLFWGLQKVIFAACLEEEPGEFLPQPAPSQLSTVCFQECVKVKSSCKEWGLKDARINEMPLIASFWL